jgi:hypothetical protein
MREGMASVFTFGVLLSVAVLIFEGTAHPKTQHLVALGQQSWDFQGLMLVEGS